MTDQNRSINDVDDLRAMLEEADAECDMLRLQNKGMAAALREVVGACECWNGYGDTRAACVLDTLNGTADDQEV